LNKKLASSVGQALAPDNVDLPGGMKIIQHTKGKALRIVVTVPKERFETLISTTDQLLSHIQTAIQTVETVELKNKFDRPAHPKRRP
jgi:hypothetical protein